MGLDQHQRVLRATGLHSEGGYSFAHGHQGPGPQSAWWQQRLAHCGRCKTLEHSLRGERERGWAGGILKTAAGRRVSGTPWSRQSCRSNPIAACLEEWRGQSGKGKAVAPLPPQPLPQPAVGGARDPRGLPPTRHLVFFIPLWHVPPRGRAAAVAQLRALGFINNAARRWGPTHPRSPWVTRCGISSWQSCGRTPSLPSNLLFLFCCVSLGQRPSLSGLCQGQRSVEEPRNPCPFVPPLIPHRLTGSWLSKSRLTRNGLLYRGLTHSTPPFCRWSNRVQSEGQPADEPLLPAPFCCHSGSSQP